MHDDTLRLLRDSIRRYVEKEIVPRAAAWEEQGFVPREVLREMGKLGFLGLRHPEEYGGAGLDARATALLAEELGRSGFGGFAITVLVHTDMASPHLVHAGSAEQKKRYLPRIIAGEAITAIAVTEPDAGSDVRAIRTTARRDGDAWVLKGAKMFITNGALADVYFVAAKTDPAAGTKGVSTSTAGAPPTPRSWCSTAAACRRRTCSATKGAASTRSCATSRTSASPSAPWPWGKVQKRSS
jgi:acyl-CoA dehydrogenase